MISVDHDRWDERPVAFVVLEDGERENELREELRGHVTAEYPKWWSPDAIRFIDEGSKGARGTFSKKRLTEENVDEGVREAVAENAPGSRY